MISEEVANRICEQIAEGRSLRAILKEDPQMPASSTVFKALSQDKAFAEQYARAREAQADALFDEILDIADESSNDSYTDENGVERTNQEVVARSRIRIDARKWMAGKLRPKVYGDKVATELTGPNGGPVQVEEIRRVVVDPKECSA